MKKSRSSVASRLFSPRATLAAIGVKLRSIKLLDPVEHNVSIRQKVIEHTPFEKLQDAFIAILAGAHGLCEINTLVRSDAALQRAFGRESCAEQSVVQETLSACTPENVCQMEQALDEIFRTHSRAYQHDYHQGLQLLDVDLTGLPCGRKAEMSEKGYFGQHNIRYGRQMARVTSPHYDEIVVDRLYGGAIHLTEALRPIIAATEQTLELDETRRQRTVLRIDAGGGSINDVNYLLERGYHLLVKDYSSKRAAHYALSVKEWVEDPQHPDHLLGWALVKNGSYVRPVRRLAIRWRKKNGQRCTAMLITTLEPAQVMELLGQPVEQVANPEAVLAAYVELYHQRGGAVEIDIKESKQGLRITKRNKKKYGAQQMVMLLGTLAHNVIVWSKQWLKVEAPRLAPIGVQRIVRDVFGVSGFIEMGEGKSIKRVVLNRAAPWARWCANSLRKLLKDEHVSVNLGQT